MFFCEGCRCPRKSLIRIIAGNGSPTPLWRKISAKSGRKSLVAGQRRGHNTPADLEYNQQKLDEPTLRGERSDAI